MPWTQITLYVLATSALMTLALTLLREVLAKVPDVIDACHEIRAHLRRK